MQRTPEDTNRTVNTAHPADVPTADRSRMAGDATAGTSRDSSPAVERDLGPDSLVSVATPIYNEAENIRAFAQHVRDALTALNLPGAFELVFCNDGSTDGSGEILDELSLAGPGGIRVVHLARNFGQAAALAACLDHARGDVIIVMDGDMQDDPAAFGAFVQKWREGYDVVYAIRTSREENPLLKALFRFFYRCLRLMANVDIPLNAGNFGLIDGRVARALRQLPERNLYYPGLRAWAGHRQIGVDVPRRRRYDRKSRVGIRGLWTLAGNAVFSFSYVPVFVFRMAGAAAMLIAAALTLYALLSGADWDAARILSIATPFFAGINLLGIAIVNEYVARIYDEIKGRPRYVVERVTEDQPPAS